MTTSTVLFHAAGYLKRTAVLTSGQVERLHDTAHRIAAKDDHPYVTRSIGTTRIDQVVAANPAFLETAASEPLLAAVTPVLGPNVELVENRHNHVTVSCATTSGRLHRDVLQWSRSILTVLVYLSDCSEAGSATRIVPGSHLWPTIGEPNNGGTWMDEVEPYASLSDQAVAVPARAGDVLLLHGQLYHAKGAAPSVRPRMVLTLAYRSVDELAPEPSSRSRLVRGQRIYRGQGEKRV